MHLVEAIGAYAGLIALPALAILAALCISQARDLRRLKEWAGRAPERAAEAAQRAARTEAPVTTSRPAARHVAATAVVDRPEPSTPAARAEPVDAPRWGERHVYRGEQQPARNRKPMFAAVAVVGVAIVVVVVLLLGSGGSSRVQHAKPAAAPVSQQARVAVLNATSVAGLGAKIGGRVRGDGFQVSDVGDAGVGQRASSVVMYAPGGQAEARTVASRLGVSSTTPADPQTQRSAGGAAVIVVVGADMAGR